MWKKLRQIWNHQGTNKRVGGSKNVDIRSMVGQEKIKAYFQRARAVSHLSHAYILSGEEGMGKKTLAQGHCAFACL